MDGPSSWQNMASYAECGNQKQSPIDISTQHIRYLQGSAKHSQPLQLQHYFTNPLKIILTNNGWFVEMKIHGRHPTITGGGLGDKFRFHNIHFHWGSSSGSGSEHTVNGGSYPLEMHLVHYNMRYSGISDALASGTTDALAVIGVLFHITEEDNPQFAELIDSLAFVQKPHSKSEIPPVFSIGSLLPHNTSHSYRYSGSLTTPSCNQVVLWTVFNQTMGISETQMNKCRSVYDGHGQNMVDNYRPTQPLNNRSVYHVDPYVFTSPSECSGAGLNLPTFWTISVAMAVWLNYIFN